MRKFIYKSIVNRLKQLVDARENQIIKHFDLYNQNINIIIENEAFHTPAVFVEFADIEWQHQSIGVRDAQVTVRLHVFTQRAAPAPDELDYAEQSLDFFDLLTDINTCLHGLTRTAYLFTHDAITSVASKTDNNFAELRHDVETFACHAQDASAVDVDMQKLDISPIIN
ncbi:MAG: hypothetical protein LBG92_03040 [Prevotellaceae bacterium]|jgi:hypothetical protein|nr:hypothetical protein [Prevotellaceae bacterium]